MNLTKAHPTVLRLSGSQRDTIGALYLNGVFQHWTIEDEYRDIKVKGDTRIPQGIYPLSLYTQGHMNQEYSKYKFHKGMIMICNVPGFDGILYHLGNSEKDTMGCLLPGDSANNNQIIPGFISNSTPAYIRTYPKLVEYIQNTKNPVIEYIDLDRSFV